MNKNYWVLEVSKKSLFDGNTIFNEEISLNVLNKILASGYNKKYDEYWGTIKSRFKDVKQHLEKLKKKIIDNNLQTKPKVKNGIGRAYYANNLSYCNLSREIRHTLAKNKWVDFDIDNAHPNILYQICKKMKIDKDEYKHLERYCLKRENVLKKIHEYHFSDQKFRERRGDIKQLLISLLNNGSYDYWLNSHELTCEPMAGLYQFRDEINNIINMYIKPNNVSIYRSIVRKKKKNPLGSLMSLFLQHHERIIVEKVIKKLIKKKVIKNNEVSYQYDGFMIKLFDVQRKNLKCKYLKKITKELTGFELNWSIKNMNEDIWEMLENIKTEKELCDENNVFDNTDAGIAKLFVSLYGKDHLYHDQMGYYYNGITWEEDKKFEKMKLNICKKMSDFYSEQSKELRKQLTVVDDINENGKFSLLTKNLKKVQSNKHLDNIVGIAKLLVINDNIEFECEENIFAFNNKIYDLEKMKWIEPKREHYILLTTGYDYEEPSDEDINELEEFIKTIFPKDDERKLYLITLSTGLQPKTLEKFINANGEGANGKGCLNELCSSFFGEYAYTGANDVLLNPIRQGGNPQLAGLNLKRIVFYREPDEHQKLNISTIKEITGGSELNARKLFSNKCKINLKGTHIIECNSKPPLNGKIDNALYRRLVDVPFRATFKPDPENYTDVEYIYKANPYYKTKAFKKKYKIPLFHILLKYWKLYIESGEDYNSFICDSVREATNEYLENCDVFKTYIDENYKKTEDINDFIILKDVYNDYKDTDDWNNMTKKEKRDLKFKRFIDLISKNLFFSKNYRKRICVNNNWYSHVLRNYKIIDNDDDTNDIDNDGFIDKKPTKKQLIKNIGF